ncbi:hypothetical protein WKK05_07910 [Nostoc sp. UHCC 0302]|uniref:hypothetical protein n=1 Tax=Nostoc sp. UHCC 0302 TaxID=3134896 RepID=UPI00311CCD5E
MSEKPLKHPRIVFYNSCAAVKGLLGLIQRETQRLGLAYLTSKVAVFYSSLRGDRRNGN